MDFDVSPYSLALDGNNSLSIDSLGFIAIKQLGNTYWSSLSQLYSLRPSFLPLPFGFKQNEYI